MIKRKVDIDLNKDLFLLFGLFLTLFFIKAFLYNAISGDLLIFIENLYSKVPENILFYLFISIYYVFIFPIIWIMSSLHLIDSGINQFILFSLDILLTIIYLTLLFFLFKKIKKTYFK